MDIHSTHIAYFTCKYNRRDFDFATNLTLVCFFYIVRYRFRGQWMTFTSVDCVASINRSVIIKRNIDVECGAVYTVRCNAMSVNNYMQKYTFFPSVNSIVQSNRPFSHFPSCQTEWNMRRARLCEKDDELTIRESDENYLIEFIWMIYASIQEHAPKRWQMLKEVKLCAIWLLAIDKYVWIDSKWIGWKTTPAALWRIQSFSPQIEWTMHIIVGGLANNLIKIDIYRKWHKYLLFFSLYSVSLSRCGKRKISNREWSYKDERHKIKSHELNNEMRRRTESNVNSFSVPIHF